jgi:hypothetical protein
LVLADDGSFCISEDGFGLVGSYAIDAEHLTLRPTEEGLGEEAGSIDGDVITDPDGERWIRTEDAPACAESSIPSGTEAGPGAVGELAFTIRDVRWSGRFGDALGLLRSAHRSIGDLRAAPPRPVKGGSGTVSLTYPEPGYPGPVSGVGILLLPVPSGATPAQMVNATAHLGFALRGETKLLDEGEPVPLVLGQIVDVEGAGKLPAGHEGYIATWSTRGGDVVYAVLASSIRSLSQAIGVLALASV